MIVADTSVIVAAASPKEPEHAACAALMNDNPIVIPEAILSEIGHMLAARHGAHTEALFVANMAAGAGQVATLTRVGWQRVAELVTTYRDLPLGIADACVAATAEMVGTDRIATLDGHFRIIRPAGMPGFHLLPEGTAR